MPCLSQDNDDAVLLRCALAIMDELAPALLQVRIHCWFTYGLTAITAGERVALNAFCVCIFLYTRKRVWFWPGQESIFGPPREEKTVRNGQF